MSSTRLPGKNMKPLAGKPMVQRLLDRLQRSRLADVVCLATSTCDDDDILEAAAQEVGAACFRGSLDDVLNRTLNAARSVDADLIVEITGDCPLADPGIVDQAIARYRVGDCDYVSNMLNAPTYSVGADVQLYSTELIAEVDRLAVEPHDRNNVTPFIYHNGDRYRLLKILAPSPLDRPRYRLCVDYPVDFEVISEIYETLLSGDACFGIREVMQLLDSRPELAARNIDVPDPFICPDSVGPLREEQLPLPEEDRRLDGAT